MGAINRKNKGGSDNEAGSQSQDGKRTPPMQSLARENNKIRMDKVEYESQPGAGVTAMKPLSKYSEDKKTGANATSGQAQ